MRTGRVKSGAARSRMSIIVLLRTQWRHFDLDGISGGGIIRLTGRTGGRLWRRARLIQRLSCYVVRVVCTLIPRGSETNYLQAARSSILAISCRSSTRCSGGSVWMDIRCVRAPQAAVCPGHRITRPGRRMRRAGSPRCCPRSLGHAGRTSLLRKWSACCAKRLRRTRSCGRLSWPSWSRNTLGSPCIGVALSGSWVGRKKNALAEGSVHLGSSHQLRETSLPCDRSPRAGWSSWAGHIASPGHAGLDERIVGAAGFVVTPPTGQNSSLRGEVLAQWIESSGSSHPGRDGVGPQEGA